MLALVVGFLMVAMKMRNKKRDAAELAQAALEAATPKGPSVQDAQKDLEARMAGQVGEQARKDAEAMLQLKLPDVQTKKTEVHQEAYRRRSQEGPNRDGPGSEDVAQW